MEIYNEQGVVIREASRDDIEILAENMRKSEIDEVWASDHHKPIDAARGSFARSTLRYSMFHDGKMVAMFGVVPDSLIDTRAQVWMLTTDEIQKMKIRFLKISRKFVDFLSMTYPVLYNVVDCRHERSIAWLKWVGARIYPAQSYGPDQMPFQYFVMGGN